MHAPNTVTLRERKIEYILYTNRGLPLRFEKLTEAQLAHYDYTRAARPGDYCRIALRSTMVEEITLTVFDEA